MKIRVRAFAAYREILGKEQLELELAEGATPRAAMQALFGKRADFERLLKSTMFAVNQEYVGADHALKSGDELAFVPPIAGGAV